MALDLTQLKRDYQAPKTEIDSEMRRQFGKMKNQIGNVFANLGIYTDEKGTRGYASVPLNIIIELQKTHEKDWKTHLAARLKNEDTNLIPPTAKVLYVLSPGDLVYVPTEDEQKNGIRQLDGGRIYKTISCSEKSCFFLHYSIATIIIQKKEFEAKNKMERALTGEMIKEVCIPVKVDLLGNIIKIG